ncbi:MAG: formylglycine-generating enzyme family protein [Cyanobacteria bacterium P01_F01_bin.150]
MVSSPPTESNPKCHIDREPIEVISVQQPLNNDVSLVLVQIPEGDFMMGSPEDELERSDAEGPQHPVHIQEFWMGQYPVTQAEWRIVASYRKVNHDLAAAPSEFKGDRLPVENVSWDDAVEFCQRLSQNTGLNYRLPTEAEWEYACRAKTTTPFHFGKTITTEYANYRGTDDEYGNSGSYGGGPKGGYREETTSVGSFEVTNHFGLADMHGNVWEWCQDHWHDNYKDAPSDGSAWLGNTPQSINMRVIRGGSWLDRPWYCRSAYRGRNPPGLRHLNLGFRVVLAPQ